MDNDHNNGYGPSDSTKNSFGYGPATPYLPFQQNLHAYPTPDSQICYDGQIYNDLSTTFPTGFEDVGQTQYGNNQNFLPDLGTSYWDAQFLDASTATLAANSLAQDSFPGSAAFDPSPSQLTVTKQVSLPEPDWSEDLLDEFLQPYAAVDPAIPSSNVAFDEQTLFDVGTKDDISKTEFPIETFFNDDSWLVPEGSLQNTRGNDDQVQQAQVGVKPELSTKLETIPDCTTLWDSLDIMKFGSTGFVDPNDTSPLDPDLPALNQSQPSGLDFSFDPAMNLPVNLNLNPHPNPDPSNVWTSVDVSQPASYPVPGSHNPPFCTYQNQGIAPYHPASAQQLQYSQQPNQFALPQAARPEGGPHIPMTGVEKDEFLLRSKASGMTYKQIRRVGRFKEAESTLRGRYRSLTKTREERVRRPVWDDFAVESLKIIVGRHLREIPGLVGPSTGANAAVRRRELIKAMTKVPWKQIADEMHDRGCYRYGNSTVKKKFMEIMRLTRK